MIAVIEELMRTNRMAEAEELCCQLCSGEQAPAAGVFRLGVVARQHGNPSFALHLLQWLVSRMAANEELFHELGTACQELGRFDEAADYYLRALTMAPTKFESLFNLGLVRMAREEYETAAEWFRRAVMLRPDSLEARHNRAVCLQESGLLADAEREFRRIIHQFPDNAEARFTTACLTLLRGDFSEGLPQYETRFSRNDPVPSRDFTRPRWDGSPLDGVTILLHAEQGFGDCIQAVRYIPLVARQGGRVVLEVPAVLRRLMHSLPGTQSVVARGETLPPFDCHLPLMSLPLLFGTTLDRIPAAARYLYPDPALLAQWNCRFPDDGTLKVGLVWTGRQDHAVNRKRSCPFGALTPLWNIPGVSYYSLQVEPASSGAAGETHGALREISAVRTDFADTAACIEHLDLIVTIDTAVAHLAGALGKPVWLLLPFVADWRWLQDRTDSPWYPSMRLFRQKRRGAWCELLEQVAVALRELLKERGAAETPVPERATSEVLTQCPQVDEILQQGAVLHESERFEEALALYEGLLSKYPSLGAAHHNRANTLLAMGRYREAIAAYRKAVELIPAFAEGYATMATALQALHRPHEAMASCYRALALDSECAEAHWNLALALLQVGEFRDGWQEFEWRWRKRGFTSRERVCPQPLWDGSPLAGRTILVHGEQGFGDCFQFARYLPLLAEQGGTVIVECPASLMGVLATVPGVAAVVTAGESPPPFDCHLPIMGLPLRFGTTLDTIPTPIPYLFPSLEAVARWAGGFTEQSLLRVGLVWAGRKKPDPNRTCPLQYLQPLAAVSGVSFFSLQVENELSGHAAERQDLRLVDLPAELTDFSDTAALIGHLDLVISIDTAVAHLAGAMGKETWLLLPHAADWRWMLDRDDSPWYPSMRLFRQQNPGDWPGVVLQVREALQERAAHGDLYVSRSRPHLEASYAAGLDAMERGVFPVAERAFLMSLFLSPRSPEVFNGLGMVCREQGAITAALALFRHAVTLDPGFVNGFINLGTALHATDRFEEAVDLYRQALLIAPDDVRLHQNMGVVLQAIGEFAGARSAFGEAVRIDPGYGTARWNLAVLKLLSGEWHEGFREFEARFVKKDAVPRLHGNLPRWDGSPLPGTTLLVHAEQGFGDTLQFCRYLSLLSNSGAAVVFECQDRSLQELLQNSFPEVQVLVRGDRLPDSDLQVPLLSLPSACNTTLATVPAEVPYLYAPHDRVAFWRGQLEQGSSLRVGLVWAGRLKPDPKRSMDLADLAPLATVPGTDFYSLQVGRGREQLLDPPHGLVVNDYTDCLRDFADTAALVAVLDLVVTIDSAVAHLAGALGKKTWLLLPYAADWRWLTGRDDSPWYPTMRLFRQQEPGDWAGVIRSVARELNVLQRLSVNAVRPDIFS